MPWELRRGFADDVDAKIAVNLASMFTRRLGRPRGSFFLLGPHLTPELRRIALEAEHGLGLEQVHHVGVDELMPGEVDFVWWYGRHVVAVEVKHGRRFRREYTRGLEAFGAHASRRIVVYRGEEELDADGIRVLPVERFFRLLHAGEILG